MSGKHRQGKEASTACLKFPVASGAHGHPTARRECVLAAFLLFCDKNMPAKRSLEEEMGYLASTSRSYSTTEVIQGGNVKRNLK